MKEARGVGGRSRSSGKRAPPLERRAALPVLMARCRVMFQYLLV